MLALIRIFNGSAALLAPQFLSKRLGIDYEANPATLYVWRMFGIRTVLIGADLLLQKGERRQEALRLGIVVHASDTLAAYLAGRSGKLPANSARMITAISADQYSPGRLRQQTLIFRSRRAPESESVARFSRVMSTIEEVADAHAAGGVDRVELSELW